MLLAEEIPGPYTFFPALLEQNPNSGVLAKRGEEEGSQYINTTGRIDGARAEFVTDSNDPSLFLVLGITLIIFQTPAGPTFLLGEKGGPCRPEEHPDFIPLDTNLALGDISALCTDGMEYWLRVGYRNVYFDVNVLGTPNAWDVDVLTEIALAQLMKLQALPLVESLAFPPMGTNTPKRTPTPAGTPEVFPTPSRGPSWITQDDNGKSFFYYPTIRFGIDLDPMRYLLRDLDITECPFIGQISNWSLNGPDSLPVGFEAIEEGECTIRIRDFRTHIVVVNWP